MASNDRQRQKKLEAKKKKRQLVAKAAASAPALGRKAVQYAALPIHDCLAPEQLFETGIGSIIWSRRLADGRLAVAAFMVDVFCLGVKNALFKVMPEDAYRETFLGGMMASHDQAFLKIPPACARKLIEGAVDYADALGFAAHRDYRDAKGIFGDVTVSECPQTFRFGQNGKPFYVRGPNESLPQARQIVDRLHRRCGEGGFDYLVMGGA